MKVDGGLLGLLVLVCCIQIGVALLTNNLLLLLLLELRILVHLILRFRHHAFYSIDLS